MYGITEVITTGFALFAMLFGAGNLIFPPTLGYGLGHSWAIAGIAFILTGVGIPLVGLIAAANTGRGLNSFGEKVSPIFAKIYAIALILSIGPLLALPRTGATAYEVTFFHAGFVTPILKYVYLGVYFAIALFFSIKPSEAVDKIGKILTPILLVVLLIILVKGAFFNNLPVVDKAVELPFKTGFIEGYQTLDALATIAFSAIILNAIKNGRELTRKQELSFLLKVGFIAAIFLAIVYAGLTYIGATFGNIELVVGAERTDLLVKMTTALLGKVGYIILGICVAGACLTTAIGLIVTVATYFSETFNLSYQKLAIYTTLVGFLFAIMGVNQIVKVSVPVLIFLYPISIALIAVNFIKIEKAAIHKAVVVASGLIGLYEALGVMGVAIPSQITVIYNMLPLSNLGMAWLVPTLVAGFISSAVGSSEKK